MNHAYLKQAPESDISLLNKTHCTVYRSFCLTCDDSHCISHKNGLSGSRIRRSVRDLAPIGLSGHGKRFAEHPSMQGYIRSLVLWKQPVVDLFDQCMGIWSSTFTIRQSLMPGHRCTPAYLLPVPLRLFLTTGALISRNFFPVAGFQSVYMPFSYASFPLCFISRYFLQHAVWDIYSCSGINFRKIFFDIFIRIFNFFHSKNVHNKSRIAETALLSAFSC